MIKLYELFGDEVDGYKGRMVFLNPDYILYITEYRDIPPGLDYVRLGAPLSRLVLSDAGQRREMIITSTPEEIINEKSKELING